MTWSEQAKEYAEAITAAKAYHDPQKAMSNRPCVLVGLPTADWTAVLDGADPVLSWQFIALASKDTNGLAAFHELEQLVAAVEAVFTIDTGRPGTYRPGSAAVPCYVLTVTDPGVPS